MKMRLAVMALMILTFGCASVDVKPAAPLDMMPVAWSVTSSGQDDVSPQWWKSFGSDELSELIDRAFKNSPDAFVAAEKVVQAEMTLRTAGASLFPSVDVSGSGSWKRTKPDGSSASDSRSTSLSLGVSYEVDLWGRISAQNRSAEASYRSVKYDYDAVKLSLAAGVADGYFQYLSLSERLLIAQKNLKISENILKIVESRYRNGSVSELDLVSQQASVLSQQSTLLSLQEQLKQVLNALAVLTGSQPQGFTVSGKSIIALNVPAVSAGLPSELLLRRPDLASAEAGLAAADANIEAARAAMFPSLSLSASGGLSSTALISLANPTTALALSGSVMQTIFDGGTKKYAVKTAESKRRELAETYRKSVLTAFQEVEDALNTEGYSARRETIQSESVMKNRKSLELSTLRYRQGAEDMNTVLSAQQSMNQAEDELIQLRLSRLSNMTALYKSLGGGWRVN